MLVLLCQLERSAVSFAQDSVSDPVLLGLIGAVVTIANALISRWDGHKTREVVKEKVGEVHVLVNDRSTQQDDKISALKQEVGRLNENSGNSTPETGGSVNMQHGQVIVPTREPEVKG